MPSPNDEKPSPGKQSNGVWERLILWLRLNRLLVWAAGLAAGLVIFLVWLPPYVLHFFGRSLQAQPVLAGLIVGFGLLTLSLLWSTGQQLDAWAFLFFNLRGHRPPWLDLLMSGFTQIGNSLTGLALALILFFAGVRLLAYGIVLGTLTLWLVVELVKSLARRRRPFVRLTQTRVVGRRERGRSFPSGHTSQVFFMAMILAGYFHVGGWAVGLLYATASLVGITRIYVGAHYPRDVLAGAILGSAWGLLGGIFFGYGL
jgi:membrane-associated phospholipid phosphatase